MRADARTERDVNAVLTELQEAYRSRSLPRVMACFAPDADVVLYGTGADEKRVGPEEIRAQVERDWAQTDAAAMVFGSTAVSGSGPVAWTSSDGAFELRAGGQDITLPARVTCVLEQRDGRWLIVNSHFSTPAAAQEEGHSF
jgi:uncharacterized protein (TIGR02246 family)